MSVALAQLGGPDRAGAGRRLSFRPFSDLESGAKEPDWLWEGFLARGVLAMLAGRPFAGKTTLVGGLLRALEAGSPFLGQETAPASAVLITEEHEVTLRPKIERLGLGALRSVRVSRGDGVFSLEWRALIEQAAMHALENAHGLLVVDTFTGLARLQAEEENDAGAITERLLPLQAAAGEGLGVLFLHHLNKNGQPRGSTAFRGVADVSIRMEREKGHGAFRLTTESRFPSPPFLRGKLIESALGWEYVAAQTTASRSASPYPESVDKRLLQALIDGGRPGLTYAELGALPGLSEDLAKKRLPAWEGVTAGRNGNGHKGDPYRWYALASGESGAVRSAWRGVNGTESL